MRGWCIRRGAGFSIASSLALLPVSSSPTFLFSAVCFSFLVISSFFFFMFSSLLLAMVIVLGHLVVRCCKERMLRRRFKQQ